MSAIATVRAAPGLDDYLAELEDRLAEAVAARPGLVAEIGAEALSSGGKRLRPLLVFLTARPEDDPPLAASGPYADQTEARPRRSSAPSIRSS